MTTFSCGDVRLGHDLRYCRDRSSARPARGQLASPCPRWTSRHAERQLRCCLPAVRFCTIMSTLMPPRDGLEYSRWHACPGLVGHAARVWIRPCVVSSLISLRPESPSMSASVDASAPVACRAASRLRDDRLPGRRASPAPNRPGMTCRSKARMHRPQRFGCRRLAIDQHADLDVGRRDHLHVDLLGRQRLEHALGDAGLRRACRRRRSTPCSPRRRARPSPSAPRPAGRSASCVRPATRLRVR